MVNHSIEVFFYAVNEKIKVKKRDQLNELCIYRTFVCTSKIAYLAGLQNIIVKKNRLNKTEIKIRQL